jgi:hypothetical protein
MRAYLCVGLVALAAACGAPGKEDPTDDFSELAGLDEKSDKFQGKFTVGNSAAVYGSTTTINVSATKVYGAIVFYGNGGDTVEVRASAKNKDSVLWLLDDKYEILAYNDDTNGSLNSYVKATLPAGSGRKYYAVARDYYRRGAQFTIRLDGKSNLTSCDSDADCVKIQAGCCPHQGQTAVNVERRWEYQEQLDATCPGYCIAIAPPADFRSPSCNQTTKSCELIEPKFCGGIAAFPCPDGFQCQDDPRDDCSVETGGADCGGICQQCPTKAGCPVGQLPAADGCACETPKDTCASDSDCEAGSHCDFCWFNKQCIPDGAIC